MGEVTLKGYKCERCGHVWLPKEQEAPRVCPKCKSPYWDRPRRTQLDFKEKRKLRY
jgi:predicted Zn-ribbon and HTH transcriptional regulator